ncbi:DUF2799 domain-containing protein [Parachitinimonas caeni]|uniref:DUF2799 domain-containing protein n=1 Tax=Parachitinimonas caeni TaxID=3031301 RepID=A0ABT7E191_9NEIS|nr:DUF2799 domain-containing protein [Parachitinimonas caeni]MDK2126078.1 DUF2799 domain-containing protein [Parachitinimonas caeni]
MKALALLAVSSLLLSGCAAMSEAECRAGDWYGTGEKDGRDGRESRLGDYADACQKVNVIPNGDEYARGRERGLRAYCTPENGYRAGRDGYTYRNVCPRELQGDFLREYERGRARYELKRDIDNTERDMANWDREINLLNDKISKATTDDDRRKFRRERENYERMRRDAQSRLIMLRAKWLVQGD